MNIGYPPNSGYVCDEVLPGATPTESYHDFACGVASVIAWNNMGGNGGWGEPAYNVHAADQDSVAYLIGVSLQHWEDTIHEIDDLGSLLEWLSYFPELARIPSTVQFDSSDRAAVDQLQSEGAGYCSAIPK